MNFFIYLRDHMLGFVLWGIVTMLSTLFMMGLSIFADAVVYVEVLFAAAYWVPFFTEYVRRRRWWDEVETLLDELDRKYQLPVVLGQAPFAEAELFTDVVERMAQSMNDEVAAHGRARREYREYLERWIHEVKTPIASAQLTAHNHPSPEMRQVARDLARIESRVMQALYYARSSAVEKDYFVEAVTLQSLVDAALKRNAKELIAAKFRIEKPEMPQTVYTDPKWVGFVLDQIIQNAIKYRSGDTGVLRFAVADAANSCDLLVEDEGIGISDEDLGRVFEKGFTGATGRTHAASTGMGLYIAAQLMDKMHHAIRAQHGAAGGFLVRLHFPESPVHNFSD